METDIVNKYKSEITERFEEILWQDKKAETGINVILFDGYCSTKIVPLDNPKELLSVLTS